MEIDNQLESNLSRLDQDANGIDISLEKKTKLQMKSHTLENEHEASRIEDAKDRIEREGLNREDCVADQNEESAVISALPCALLVNNSQEKAGSIVEKGISMSRTYKDLVKASLGEKLAEESQNQEEKEPIIQTQELSKQDPKIIEIEKSEPEIEEKLALFFAKSNLKKESAVAFGATRRCGNSFSRIKSEIEEFFQDPIPSISFDSCIDNQIFGRFVGPVNSVSSYISPILLMLGRSPFRKNI